jgi:hypothetical protein
MSNYHTNTATTSSVYLLCHRVIYMTCLCVSSFYLHDVFVCVIVLSTWRVCVCHRSIYMTCLCVSSCYLHDVFVCVIVLSACLFVVVFCTFGLVMSAATIMLSCHDVKHQSINTICPCRYLLFVRYCIHIVLIWIISSWF